MCKGFIEKHFNSNMGNFVHIKTFLNKYLRITKEYGACHYQYKIQK